MLTGEICPTGFIPLCDATTALDAIATGTGICVGTLVQGCIGTTLATTWRVCSSLAGTTTRVRYPSAIGTASQYKFTGKLQTGGTYALVSCSIHTASDTDCNAAATGSTGTNFVQEAYPAGELETDEQTAYAVQACVTYWKRDNSAYLL
jgi:hypothetical protein